MKSVGEVHGDRPLLPREPAKGAARAGTGLSGLDEVREL
jgi:hypothetical protein